MKNSRLSISVCCLFFIAEQLKPNQTNFSRRRRRQFHVTFLLNSTVRILSYNFPALFHPKKSSFFSALFIEIHQSINNFFVVQTENSAKGTAKTNEKNVFADVLLFLKLPILWKSFKSDGNHSWKNICQLSNYFHYEATGSENVSDGARKNGSELKKQKRKIDR